MQAGVQVNPRKCTDVSQLSSSLRRSMPKSPFSLKAQKISSTSSNNSFPTRQLRALPDSSRRFSVEVHLLIQRDRRVHQSVCMLWGRPLPVSFNPGWLLTFQVPPQPNTRLHPVLSQLQVLHLNTSEDPQRVAAKAAPRPEPERIKVPRGAPPEAKSEEHPAATRAVRLLEARTPLLKVAQPVRPRAAVAARKQNTRIAVELLLEHKVASNTKTKPVHRTACLR